MANKRKHRGKRIDRPMSDAATPSTTTSSCTTPNATTSSAPAAVSVVESEVSTQAATDKVEVDSEKRLQPVEVTKTVDDIKENDAEATITPNNTEAEDIHETSLADISGVPLEDYLDESVVERPISPVEAAKPSIVSEKEAKLPESLVNNEDKPRTNNNVDVGSKPEPPEVTAPAPTLNNIAPAQEIGAQPPTTTTTSITKEKGDDETTTPELTDSTLTMQNEKGGEEVVLQNGDEGINDDGEEFIEESAGESLEEGEIEDSSEDQKEVGSRKRIVYDRETLLHFKAQVNKDALPDMNSIPQEVIKDGKSSNQNHSRGSPSPGLGGFHPMQRQSSHSGNARIGRFPMDMRMGNFRMPIPPPPPSGITPKRIIEERKDVGLHKADKAWKPTPLERQDRRTRGQRGVEEPKDEEEIIKDDIVKKTRGILNKLTPENFDKLVHSFLELNLEDKDDRIAAVIYVVFEKAIDEPSFSTAYANMVKTVCDKSQLTAKKFRKNILDQCQKEFQKGSTAEEEIKALQEKLAETAEDKKEAIEVELADKKYASRRRSLGNVRFIGELYKLQMLTPKIMIDCVGILLGNADEESYESLCKLLTTIGQRLDNQLRELEVKAHQAARAPANSMPPVKFNPPEKYMDKTFAHLKSLSQENHLSSRIRFALMDVVELRDSSWKPRRDADGPKKIGEVHRDAARQQQEEKIQIQNLPPQGQAMRQGLLPPKKQEWSTVSTSNKSSRFLTTAKKPMGMGSGMDTGGPPMLAPTTRGWNAPGPGLLPSGPSKNTIPPRMMGRFGALSTEDRTPAPPPLRESIVQPVPPPLRRDQGSRESSRPQTPTREQQKPEPLSAPPPPQQTPPPEPKEIANIPECVKNIFQEFVSTNSWDDVLYYFKERFPGEKIVDFVEELSRQVADMDKEIQQKAAGGLVKGLIKKGLITKAQVIKVFTDNTMVDLPDIEVDVPKVTSYFGVFLVELFLDEPDLSWLVPLADNLEESEECMKVWSDLVANTLNFLKLRLTEEAVQVLYKKTSCANKLPVQDISWITGESIEALSKKMLSVLEKEKDSAMISQSFKENSWDLREEKTGMGLTEAICQISWKASSGWDVPLLEKLLPQLNASSPKLQSKLWNQAKDFIQRNSLEKEAEDQLWNEMYRLKIISNESQQTPC